MYTASEARKCLSELLSRVAFRGERINITKHGKVVAVLVSPEDAALLKAHDEAEGTADRPALQTTQPDSTETFAEVLLRNGYDPAKFGKVAELLIAT